MRTWRRICGDRGRTHGGKTDRAGWQKNTLWHHLLGFGFRTSEKQIKRSNKGRPVQKRRGKTGRKFPTRGHSRVTGCRRPSKQPFTPEHYEGRPAHPQSQDPWKRQSLAPSSAIECPFCWLSGLQQSPGNPHSEIYLPYAASTTSGRGTTFTKRATHNNKKQPIEHKPNPPPEPRSSPPCSR